LAKFEHHVLVCTNVREPGSARGSCTNDGKGELLPLFKDKIKDAGLKSTVRVNKSGCLDQCEHGPTVVVYPDAVWYGFVTPGDVEEIVQSHLVNGRPVERLVLADSCINTATCPHKPRPAAAAQEVSVVASGPA
jgi:(2Fe-2S) ferredoxin